MEYKNKFRQNEAPRGKQRGIKPDFRINPVARIKTEKSKSCRKRRCVL